MRRILFVCHGNICLTQHGVQFDPSETARTVTKADYNRFDRIICMDQSNLRWLSRIIDDDSHSVKLHSRGYGLTVAPFNEKLLLMNYFLRRCRQ